MRPFSRRLRISGAGRLAITVTTGNHDSVGAGRHREQWRCLYELLSERRLAATWAVTGKAPWHLDEELFANPVAHELAFEDNQGDFASQLPKFHHQIQLAQRLGLKMRTLVTSSAGVHPALLAQLRVEALVAATSDANSQTGSLRALAWNVWEMPITDHVATNFIDVERLAGRLEQAIRQSTRMHLVMQPTACSLSEVASRLARFLDQAADYQARGWICVETAGRAASELTRKTTRTAA